MEGPGRHGLRSFPSRARSPRPATRALRAARLAALSALVLPVAACLGLAPADPPAATAGNRVAFLARLLEIEDRRLQDPVLLGRLANASDPWLRSRAALTAGRLKDPDTSPYLPVLLLDPEPQVRRAAAAAAGFSGDRRLVRFLGRALGDADAQTAAEAAFALGRLGGDEAGRLLVERIEKGDGSDGALGAATGATFRLRDASLVPLLGRLAGDAPPAVRRGAAFSLARSPRPGSEEPLRALLVDADPDIVAWAARGLGLLGDVPSLAALARLASSPETGVAVQALFALERIGARAPLRDDVLRAVLGRARDADRPGVAVAALTALRRAEPGDALVTAFLAATVTSGGRRGGVALTSLARLDALRAEGLAFASGAPQALRLGAAEALPLLPPAEAVRWASRLLDDPAPRVRMEALGRLPAEGGPVPAALLGKALADPDGAVRAAAVEASASSLARLPELRDAWLGAFRSAVASGEADWGVTAVDAAASVTGGEELLRGLADHRDGVVRERARKALVERFGARRASFATVEERPRPGRGDLERVARDALEALYVATVTTSRGTFELELWPEAAPLTVDSFVSLARRGFFDRTVVHRVVPDFVVQAGDPRGDGTGGPGYALRDELTPAPYVRGTVGLALSGPDTGGSQWFVTLSRQPHLDGAYTAFGRVRSGLDVLDRVEQDDALVSVTVRREPRAAGPPGLADR